jgi:hypothetical protein
MCPDSALRESSARRPQIYDDILNGKGVAPAIREAIDRRKYLLSRCSILHKSPPA